MILSFFTEFWCVLFCFVLLIRMCKCEWFNSFQLCFYFFVWTLNSCFILLKVESEECFDKTMSFVIKFFWTFEFENVFTNFDLNQFFVPNWNVKREVHTNEKGVCSSYLCVNFWGSQPILQVSHQQPPSNQQQPPSNQQQRQ